MVTRLEVSKKERARLPCGAAQPATPTGQPNGEFVNCVVSLERTEFALERRVSES
jgi:hypothetical protein